MASGPAIPIAGIGGTNARFALADPRAPVRLQTRGRLAGVDPGRPAPGDIAVARAVDLLRRERP